MAGMGIESGSVDNRTFSSTSGFAYALDLWFLKSYVNHGPGGWFRWDDQRGAGSNPYVVYCNQSSPTPNSKALFIKVTVDSGLERIYFEWYLYWNNSTHTGLVRAGDAIHYLTTKSGAFAYYFRGGDNIMMFIARDGSSVTTVRLSKGIGLWDGSAKFLEPETTSGVLTATANLVNGTASVTLGSGQGANFRINAWYYMIDLTSGTAKVAYVKVTAKSGDVLTVQYTTAKSFPAGAYISPYPHRWLLASNQTTQNAASVLPYGSTPGSETLGTTSTASADWMVGTVSRVNPDDEGDYVAMQPWWGETSGNRTYFKESEYVVGAPAGLSPFTDRRVIGGVPYMCIALQSGFAALVRDQESLS